LNVTEKLHLIGTYGKLNLRSLSQREAVAKLGVLHPKSVSTPAALKTGPYNDEMVTD
jgi:hypothetical protein